MTDITDGLGPLPTRVQATRTMVQRVIPPQRLQDEIAKLEGRPYKEVAEAQGPRCEIFRVLVRDWPLRDVTSLWLHSYDCELEIVNDDPTNGSLPTPAPLSAVTTGVFPETSTS
jgi:hypothetical protein